jgi:ribose/xylose/arabinose/galactoside ABC-type transport system permease subunit
LHSRQEFSTALLVSVFRLNAIIATIGVNALLYGAVFAVSGGTPSITTDLLATIAGGETLGLPNSVWFALLALGVVTFVLKKTVVGRRFEAVGANPLAARAAGLAVRRHQFMAYVYAQLLYCLAGVLNRRASRANPRPSRVTRCFCRRWLSLSSGAHHCWAGAAFRLDRHRRHSS